MPMTLPTMSVTEKMTTLCSTLERVGEGPLNHTKYVVIHMTMPPPKKNKG